MELLSELVKVGSFGFTSRCWQVQIQTIMSYQYVEEEPDLVEGVEEYDQDVFFCQAVSFEFKDYRFCLIN